MNDDLTGLTAIAWALVGRNWQPGASAQVYRIMWVDVYVAVDKGRTAENLTYKVCKFDTPEKARAFAVWETARIERRGFDVTVLPKAKKVVGGTRTWLDELVGKRTQNGGLIASVRVLIDQGEDVGWMS